MSTNAWCYMCGLMGIILSTSPINLFTCYFHTHIFLQRKLIYISVGSFNWYIIHLFILFSKIVSIIYCCIYNLLSMKMDFLYSVCKHLLSPG